MTTIFVTNTNDSGDGSLRAAVAIAENGDTIDLSQVNGVIRLQSSIAISTSITIDGRRPAQPGSHDVTDIQGQPGGLVVQAGADVTFQHLYLTNINRGVNAKDNAEAGEDGDPGKAGGLGQMGGDGTAGTNATSSTGGVTPGDPAIINNGTLKLVLCQIQGMSTGGDGADGADGGGGGDAGQGGTQSPGSGLVGGLGGTGGGGSSGTAGGDAVGGIINTGTLTIQDTVIIGQAGAGDGGNGGGGGDGGKGGDGGGGTAPFMGSALGGRGGDGGSGGIGGDGGNGGSAVGGIVNTGKVIIVGAGILTDDSADAGKGGAGGKAGDAGMGGSGGNNAGVAGKAPDGMDGNEASAGNSGTAGTETDDYLDKGTTTGSFTIGHYFYDIVTDYPRQAANVTVGEGNNDPVTFTYDVGEFGGFEDGFPVAGSVDWRVVTGVDGPLPSDFVGPTSGTLTYGTNEAGEYLERYINVQLKGDASAPRDESFTVEIYNPATGDVLGSVTSIDQGVTNAASPLCFASGTRILTARGDVAVQDLAVGDLAVTASGAMRPIRWLGHRTVSDECPVRISASAFGASLPARDLHLSPGHPVLVGANEDGEGGHLVPIMCLINGTTIDRVAVDEVTYWHVELDAHDILLAEGLPAESYIDLGSRPWFAGAEGAFYDPDFAAPGELGRCRPVATDGTVVEAERSRLDAVFVTRLAGACAWPAPDDLPLPLT